tara:strand:- start:820 stop:972 length:153 start_codon:yes stop_codon:yes gene_type:complete
MGSAVILELSELDFSFGGDEEIRFELIVVIFDVTNLRYFLRELDNVVIRF